MRIPPLSKLKGILRCFYESMSCRLIVHADDFGISEQVNNGICLAHQEGILTSTSIMASGVAFEHGVNLLKQNPSLEVGIHLTLIEELPLLPKQLIPSLVGKNGLFFDHATTFIKRYLTGRIRLSEVRKEIDQQIRKVLDAGIPLSHLDSHQHIHALPGIRAVVFELAKKYGIPAVRLPSEQFHSYMLRSKGGLARLAQLFVLKVFCQIGHWRGVSSPDYFMGFFLTDETNGTCDQGLRGVDRQLYAASIRFFIDSQGLAHVRRRFEHHVENAANRIGC